MSRKDSCIWKSAKLLQISPETVLTHIQAVHSLRILFESLTHMNALKFQDLFLQNKCEQMF